MHLSDFETTLPLLAMTLVYMIFAVMFGIIGISVNHYYHYYHYYHYCYYLADKNLIDRRVLLGIIIIILYLLSLFYHYILYLWLLLLGFSILFWSVATSLAGFASNIVSLTLLRSLVGVGEACYGTVGPPLLADFYPVNGIVIIIHCCYYNYHHHYHCCQ